VLPHIDAPLCLSELGTIQVIDLNTYNVSSDGVFMGWKCLCVTDVVTVMCTE